MLRSRVAPAVLVLVALFALWRALGPRGHAPGKPRLPAPPADTKASDDEPAPPSRAPVRTRSWAPARPVDPAGGRRRASFHTADPCLAVGEPTIPEGYETLEAQGITVAWPSSDGVLAEPTALAYLAAGLLEEAARVTSSERREQVTVVVYGSTDEFHAVGGAPSWASGLYDGAVKLPPTRTEFGVRIRTLRHELMHAQLHVGVGCMPIWFNEGMAMQFARDAPQKPWVHALRTRRLVDFAKMEVSTVEDVGVADLDAVYAQSLAMVLLLQEPPGEDGLSRAMRALRGRPPGTPLWARIRPDAGAAELLDSLGRRVFGVPRGPELDAIFQAAVCCYGSTLQDFGCRGAPIEPGKRFWVDESRKPHAFCDLD